MMSPNTRRSYRQRAYTLVELITVIAITGILLTIIVVPMFQSFNLTRAAQSYADAQDKARVLSERISREIANSAGVRDPNGEGGTILVRVPIPAAGENEAGTRITPAAAGQIQAIPLQYAKIDLIPPAEGKPGRGPNGGFEDPNTGKEDPTLSAPKGQITLPLTQGQKLVRYFVGLRDPFVRYNNPYDGILLARNGARDNLYVLYRAEVEPMIGETVNGVGRVTVNQAFFDLDPNAGGAQVPLYDVPDFFLANLEANGTPITNDAKATRIRNWLRRAVVQTEVSRYDLISAEYNNNTRLARLDANERPKLLPLLQFRPDRVSNDPAEGQTAIRLGDEAENGQAIGPETYKTKFGAWSNGVVRVYEGSANPSTSLYSIGKEYVDGANRRRYGVYAVDPTGTLADNDPTSGTLLFDITQYLDARKSGRRYPFSEALDFANASSGWLNGANPQLKALFTPFVIQTEKGQVNTSFGIDEIGPAQNGVEPRLQLPSAPANSYSGANANISYTPANDPIAGQDPAVGVFSDAQYASLNARFNKIWIDAQKSLNGVPSIFAERGVAQRFIDLRQTPSGDNIISPLDPTRGFLRTKIVPGSEEVFGPDMSAGPNYGYEIRYRRTTRDIPGPNEYTINYVDLREPDYQTVWGVPTPPATYDATNFSSAVVQPRYKAGYVKLCSEPNIPIPALTISRDANGIYVQNPTRIRVGYRFQMTDSKDVVAVDYDTRQLISVLLTIRNYAQSNLPNPPSVSLKATATARNILR